MWRVNKIGKEQVWYEAELIEQIKAECNECYQNNVKYYGLALKILDLIQEYEQ